MDLTNIRLIEGSVNNNHVLTNVPDLSVLQNVEIGEIAYQKTNDATTTGVYVYNGAAWNKSPLDADSNGSPIVYANSTNKISSTILPSNIAYIDNTTTKLDPSIIPAITFASISTKPTTLLGYGITDAINTDKLGVASGVATLNESGQLTASQIPSSLASGLTFKGNWDATTTAPSTSGLLSGSYYIVSVAGPTSITTSAGPIADWKVSDWLIYNGTNWDKIDNSDIVSLGANVFTGNQTAPTFIGSNFISNASQGTAPLTITSTTLVNNLNVESWNGTKLDSTTPTTNGMVLSYDTSLSKAKWISVPNSTDASALTTGTLNAARLPAFTGDATSTAGSSALTLANSGVTAGTYSKVTVNAKGLVTTGANLAAADIDGVFTALSGVTDGSTWNNVTINTKGRITGASNVSYALLTANTFTGNQTAPVFVSNVAQGTAPLIVTSTTKVLKLNAEYISDTKVTNSATVGGLLIGDATAGTAKWIASGDVTVDSTSAPTKTKVTALHNLAVNAPVAADSGKMLSYDHANTTFKWLAAPGGISNVSISTLSANLTLTVDSQRLQNVTAASGTSYVINLPNTTTLSLGGPAFIIKHTGIDTDANITINAAGSLLTTLYPGSTLQFFVVNNSTNAVSSWNVTDISTPVSNAVRNTVVSRDNTGSIFGTDFYSTSDIRTKENINDLVDSNVLDLQPKTFNFIGNDKLHYGLIAQDVKSIFPELVNENDDNMLSVNYLEVVTLLLAKVKQQAADIEMIKQHVGL